MSRTFTIKELNEKIDELVIGYQADLNFLQREGRVFEAKEMSGKITALEELKAELNDPEPLVNVTEKIQESLNIIETNKIINSRGANRFKADDE